MLGLPRFSLSFFRFPVSLTEAPFYSLQVPSVSLGRPQRVRYKQTIVSKAYPKTQGKESQRRRTVRIQHLVTLGLFVVAQRKSGLQFLTAFCLAALPRSWRQTVPSAAKNVPGLLSFDLLSVACCAGQNKNQVAQTSACCLLPWNPRCPLEKTGWHGS